MLRLHLAVQEDAFLEIKPAARAAPPSADRVMVVLNSKTGQRQLPHVRNIIAIRVLEEEHVRRLSDVAAAIGELDSRWKIKPFGKHRRLVGLSIAIDILQDDNLIVGHFAWFDLRIGPGTSDPQASTRIPNHVNRIGQHGICRKEIYLVTREQIEALQLRGRIVIIHQSQIRVLEICGLYPARILGHRSSERRKRKGP